MLFRSVTTLTTLMLTAGTPIVLLHAGAYKNDLALSCFVLMAAVWLESWVNRGDVPSGLLSAFAVLAGLATKVSGLVLLLVWTPLFLYGLQRRLKDPQQPSLFTRQLALPGLMLGLMGLIAISQPIINLYFTGHPLLQQVTSKMDGDGSHYGDWINILRFPILVMMVPFTSKPGFVWVPWAHEYWWWQPHDIFFSHFGHALLQFIRRRLVLHGLRERLGVGIRRAAEGAAGTARATTLIAAVALIGAADVEEQAEITAQRADAVAGFADFFEARGNQLPLVVVFHFEQRADVFLHAFAHVIGVEVAASARLLFLGGGGGGERADGERGGGEEG